MNSSPSVSSVCTDAADPDELRVEEVSRRMLDAVETVKGYEQVGLAEAAGRVLHEPLRAPIDVPSYTNSAVDGYAVRAADLPAAGRTVPLSVAGTARAGSPYIGTLGPGQAVRVMTGAPIPAGGDTVVMQEFVEVVGDCVRVDGGHEVGENVRRAGEDIRKGETVLSPGRFLMPPDVGLIASIGVGEIKVKRQPRVALLSNGDEVYAVGRTLTAGGIYDSNRYTLQAALKRLPVKILDQGIVPDDPGLLREGLLRAASMADVVVSSGGVSMGQADFVRKAVKGIGEVAFWKVAMKPGRPVAFGRIGTACFVGLPGNPVAALIGFLLFVRPVLEKKMGVIERLAIPTFTATSVERLRKKPGRVEFQRGILEQAGPGQWQVRTSGPQGSGVLSSMSRANALIVLPYEGGTVEAGEVVEVLPLSVLM